MSVNYFTKQGLQKLKKELDYLRDVKRKEIAQAIHQAASFGDLSENAAYKDAKEEKAFCEGRILELEKLIINAKIIEHSRKASKVEVGSTVLVKFNTSREEVTIVGPAEADFAAGKISYESPLGKALLGKSIEQEIEVNIENQRKIKYKILKIV